MKPLSQAEEEEEEDREDLPEKSSMNAGRVVRGENAL